MDRRQSPRVSVQLPVNVWGMDAFGQPFTCSAMVTNMSTGGLVLRGVLRRLRIGDTLDISMGATKAQFRIIWLGEATEVGLQAITSASFFPSSVLVHCSQSAAAC